MTTPSNSLPDDDDVPNDAPDELSGIALRLQAAINEALLAKEDSDGPSASAQHSEEVEPGSSAGAVVDRRLYFPDSEGWEFRVKSGSREYCSHRNPGEDWFHLLLDGELFLQFGEEKVCLNCAVRSGLLTDDRLYWQKGHRRQRIFPLPEVAPPMGGTSEITAELLDQPLMTEYILENPTERQT